MATRCARRRWAASTARETSSGGSSTSSTARLFGSRRHSTFILPSPLACPNEAEGRPGPHPPGRPGRVVRAEGLEPPPACADQILNLAPMPVRLRPPLPPIAHHLRHARQTQAAEEAAGHSTDDDQRRAALAIETGGP